MSRAKAFDCVLRIVRARRIELAGPAVERREEALIGVQEHQQQSSGWPRPGFQFEGAADRVALRTSWTSSTSNAANFAAATELRG